MICVVVFNATNWTPDGECLVPFPQGCHGLTGDTKGHLTSLGLMVVVVGGNRAGIRRGADAGPAAPCETATGQTPAPPPKRVQVVTYMLPYNF